MKYAMRLLLFTTVSMVLLSGLRSSLTWADPPSSRYRFGQVVVSSNGHARIECEEGSPLCADTIIPIGYNHTYVGHDEPSLLFYSNVPGSGFRGITYNITLPKDPPTLPKQGGGGGTDNFMLHPAFWFGMAMCDTQSYPLATNVCKPNTDSNIFNNEDPLAPDFLGHHPGAAFMEMQFYPPGWVGSPANQWSAALNIDSFSRNPATNQELNGHCKEIAGVEYVNFAFLTKNGKPHGIPNPVKSTLKSFFVDPTKDLLMNPGDHLTLIINDTPAGLKITVHDLTTGQTGSMTASKANGFGQVKFAPPPATSCTNIPYSFHPMYATSSESTRVPWAAHSYNIAFSDEIGHFDYCNDTNIRPDSKCVGTESDKEKADADDTHCYDKNLSSFYQISGCFGDNTGFDGPAYKKDWPGTNSDATQDASLHPTAIEFSSPKFDSGATGPANYDRVAFEVNMASIEPSSKCNIFTGAGCTNPPHTDDGPPTAFYPIYTTGTANDACVWHFGGTFIPGTTNTFGGTSKTEFGSLFPLFYVSAGGTSVDKLFLNFRQILSENPCTN